MPVWKFCTEPPGPEIEELEDVSLDLAAMAQDLRDLLSALEITDGTVLSDLLTRFDLAALSLDSDLKTELAAYFQSIDSASTFLSLSAEGLKDALLTLAAHGLSLSDAALILQLAKVLQVDVKTVLEVAAATIMRDMMLDLVLSNGYSLNDLGLCLSVMKEAPSFRSIVAQRLSSIVSEVA
jgi:hypothetical protein